MYHSPKQSSIHRGFSLMELLLVIFIISLVYFLGFSSIEKSEKRKVLITPLNLKKEVMQNSSFEGEGTLLCTDKCRTCYLRKDISSPFKEIEGALSLGRLEVYMVNHRDELYKHDYGRYQDHRICLLVDFYHNGSSTPLILKNDEGIYYLPAFFGTPKEVRSLDEAKNLWLAHTNELKDQGGYY